MKKRIGKISMISQVPFMLILVMVVSLLAPAFAQQTQETKPYSVGNPLGMPAADGTFEPISSNVKVYGGIYGAESCSYDPERGVIVVPNRGAPQNVQTNDAWVSLINHDGSVHTLRWIGLQHSDERKSLSPPLVLNEPFGSDIINDILYVADRDGGTSDDDPSIAVIRQFDMKTGEPVKEIRVEDAPWINDIEVKEDGTIYATQTGDFFGENPNPDTWKVWKVTPSGEATIFVQGKPLNAPNGIAFDPDAPASTGPSLYDLYGSEVPLQNGRTVTADEAYLRESILNANAKIVAGYMPVMPSYEGQIAEEEVSLLVSYITSL